MKYIFAFTFLLKSFCLFSQVIIGDDVGSATNKTSVILDFSTKENRGIVLPYITELPQNPVGGTLILDATTPQKARVKYYNGTEWVDLSGNDGIVTQDFLQPPIYDGQVIINASESHANGALILEDQTKAMILPMVSDYKSIINPAAGMIVYIKKDRAKRLAVFNGSKWSFWKSESH